MLLAMYAHMCLASLRQAFKHLAKCYGLAWLFSPRTFSSRKSLPPCLTPCSEYFRIEELVGRGWPLNLRLRLNQAPVVCKRPSAADVMIAKMQYPQLFP